MTEQNQDPAKPYWDEQICQQMLEHDKRAQALLAPSGYHLIELAHKGKGGCSRGKGARHVGAIAARPARISVNSVVLSSEVPKDQATEDFINARIRELLTSDNTESNHGEADSPKSTTTK